MNITFNAIGVVSNISTSEGEFRQGSVGNQIKAYFTGKDNVNYLAKINFTRPDGSHIDNIIMTVLPNTTNGFVFTLNSNWYLQLDGNATATIFLYNGSNNIVAQGQVTIPIEESDYHENAQTITEEQYDSLLDAVALKLNISNGIVAVNSKSDIIIENYSDGQVFYVKNEQKLYYNNNGTLSLYDNNIGVIQTSSIYDGAILNKDHIALPICFILHTSTGMIYRKIKTSSGLARFSNDFDFIDGNTSQSDIIGRVYFDVNVSSGVISNSTIYSKNIYNKGQIDEQFYNKGQSDDKFVDFETDQEVSGKKTFAQLPETKADRIYGNQRQMADKGLVDQVQNNLDTHTGDSANPHNVNKSQVGLGNVTNDAQVKRTEMGVALGVATLDENGKLPLKQLTDVALGQLTKGGEVTGNGLATLTSNGKVKLGTDQNQIQLVNTQEGITGYLANQEIFYVCSSAGTFANLDLQVGDWLTANASGWSKVDNTDAVQSVQGRTGAVVIDKRDLGLEYIENDIAPLYDDTATYDINDVVIYNGKLYICIYEVTVGESFDNTKWTETNVKTLINNLKNYTDNQLYKLPEYVDITIGTNEWSNNSVSKASGVLTLTNDDVVLAIPNGIQNDQYIRTFGVEIVSFDNATGVATFECMTTPTETINITLQILRR